MTRFGYVYAQLEISHRPTEQKALENKIASVKPSEPRFLLAHIRTIFQGNDAE
jgi:hypothetical protein